MCGRSLLRFEARLARRLLQGRLKNGRDSIMYRRSGAAGWDVCVVWPGTVACGAPIRVAS